MDTDRIYTIDDGEFQTEVRAPNLRSAVMAYVQIQDRSETAKDFGLDGETLEGLENVFWMIAVWEGSDVSSTRDLIVTPWPAEGPSPSITDVATRQEISCEE